MEWIDQVEAHPIRALESFVLGWFPPEEPAPAEEENPAVDPGTLPEALAAFHRLAFALWAGASMDWSIPWPPDRADPRVWHTEDPCEATPETTTEAEPLSRFLPTYTAERFFAAPGLLATVGGDENEAVLSCAALHRETLTPLLEHDFPWSHSDG